MTPSIAAEPADARALRDIASCRGISKAKARLRCFDRETEYLEEALEQSAQTKQTTAETGEAVTAIATREEGKRLAEALPSASYDEEEGDPDASFGAEDLIKDDRERKKELRTIATSITQNKRGKYVIVLDNGQVWRQIQGDTNKLRIRRGAETGQDVIIKKRSLGAYTLRLTTAKRSILVRRIK